MYNSFFNFQSCSIGTNPDRIRYSYDTKSYRSWEPSSARLKSASDDSVKLSVPLFLSNSVRTWPQIL